MPQKEALGRMTKRWSAQMYAACVELRKMRIDEKIFLQLSDGKNNKAKLFTRKNQGRFQSSSVI